MSDTALQEVCSMLDTYTGRDKVRKQINYDKKSSKFVGKTQTCKLNIVNNLKILPRCWSAILRYSSLFTFTWPLKSEA